MCILLPLSWWTPEGNDSALPPASTFFEETMNVVNYQLVLLLFLSWGFALDFCSVSLPLNYLPDLGGTPCWNKGKVFTQKYLLYAGTERLKDLSCGVQPPGPLEQWGRGCWHNHWKTEFSPSSQQLLKSFACLRESEWVSLQMWRRSWNGNYYIKTFHLVGINWKKS